MKIGVISDIHDNLTALRAILDEIQEAGSDTVVFCGDFCSPIVARELLAGFPGSIHAVFGNGDGDRAAIQRIAQAGERLQVHGEWAELTVGGRHLAATHYPFYAQALARTGDYDAVFYGHTHERAVERFDACLCANPGDVMGWKSAPSYGIYDTKANAIELRDLPPL